MAGTSGAVKEAHDWCIISLGEPGVIKLVDINTAHFTGNYPPGAMVEVGYSLDVI